MDGVQRLKATATSRRQLLSEITNIIAEFSIAKFFLIAICSYFW